MNTLILPSFLNLIYLIPVKLGNEFDLGNLQRIDDDLDKYWLATDSRSGAVLLN